MPASRAGHRRYSQSSRSGHNIFLKTRRVDLPRILRYGSLTTRLSGSLAHSYPRRLHEHHSLVLTMLAGKVRAAATMTHTQRPICHEETNPRCRMLRNATLTPIRPAAACDRAGEGTHSRHGLAWRFSWHLVWYGSKLIECGLLSRTALWYGALGMSVARSLAHVFSLSCCPRNDS